MQRKQQVGECWVYVIFFSWSLSPSSTSCGRIFRFFTFSVMSCFAIHGILIPELELGFQRLVETLYCIVNVLYNAMKEIKRASEALRKLVFPLRVSRVIYVYLCVNAIV